MHSIISVLRAILPGPILGAYHWTLAFLAAVRYGFPSRNLTVAGVTGTDGKTTVVHLLHEMLASAGHRVGSLSSLRFRIGEREESNFLKMTMPGRFRLQRFLADCRKAGCAFAVIEVTSQGIAQHRHRCINFKAAVLTNITPEHIESHGGFEQYRAAKMRLFRILPKTGYAILNREDAPSRLFAGATAARVVWYSRVAIDGAGISHPVRVVTANQDHIALEIGNVSVETVLGGEFNVMNILAAAAAAMSFDVPLVAIATALKEFPGMAGRLEYVVREPFAVVVDYANTPAAYERVYQSLQEARSPAPVPLPAGRYGASKKQEARLICVFGAPGGGRDKWKRPELGRIASRYCEEIILTSDDPEDEEPNRIVSEIRSGMTNDQLLMTKVILDRREAIRAAFEEARPGDTVIITGMGAQPWLMLKTGKIPWDDRRIVREELTKLRSGGKL